MNTNWLGKGIAPGLREITHEQVVLLDQEATSGMGWEFYCGSYIRHPAVFGNRLSGLVRDELEEYFTEIRVDDKQVVIGCSCGARSEICKHAIALLYGWVDDNEGFQNVDDLLDRLRHQDKERIIEILGRILMFDHRTISFIDEDSVEDDFDHYGL
jgi:uncharacterized Zn finger protein